MNKPIPFGPGDHAPHIPLSRFAPVRANSRSYTNKITIEVGPVEVDGPVEISYIVTANEVVNLQAKRRLYRGDYLTIFPYELKFRLPKN